MNIKSTITTAFAVTVIFGVAACGSTASSNQPAVTTPESVAASIGCTNVTAGSTQEIYVKSLSTCQLDGKKVNLYSFANETDRDNWMKVASSFSGSGTYFPEGLVVVSAPDTATADTIRAKLG